MTTKAAPCAGFREDTIVRNDEVVGSIPTSSTKNQSLTEACLLGLSQSGFQIRACRGVCLNTLSPFFVSSSSSLIALFPMPRLRYAHSTGARKRIQWSRSASVSRLRTFHSQVSAALAYLSGQALGSALLPRHRSQHPNRGR